MSKKSTQLSLFDSPHAERGWIAFLNETLQLPQERPYLAIDLFAGCGGLSLGFECAGVKTIGYEMKPECCETYRANLNSECRNEMLTEETEYPQAYVILGGPPCQPFSRRGKRKGKDDARDGFPAYIAAIRKVQPKIWVCENVKGLPELSVISYLKMHEAHSDKHSTLSDLAKRAVDPAIKAASLAVLAKVIS